MAHNSRLATDAFYASRAPLPATWWQSLDTAQSKSINGDVGGTWTPAAAIFIQGTNLPAWTAGAANPNQKAFGLAIAGPSTLGGVAFDPVSHGDSDVIQLGAGHTGQTRTIVTSCGGAFYDISDGIARMTYDGPYEAMVNRSGLVPSFVSGGRGLVELRVHDGATFSQITLWFFVGNTHANVPTSLTQLRVYKVDAAGNVTPLKSGTAIGNGWLQFPTPGSGAAWYNGGVAQGFTYVLDGGVVIDRSTYTYFAEILDEDGTNASNLNRYTAIWANFTNIPDLRFS